MNQWPQPHRLNVDEYYKMAEVGLLAPDACVELIHGIIMDLPIPSPREASIIDQLSKLLILGLHDHAIVRTRGVVRLDRWSEPQPDVAVLKSLPDRYWHAHPSGEDTVLVIEVGDSSLDFDLGTKSKLYARHHVPELWVVDAEDGVLHRFSDRAEFGYRQVTSTATPGMTAVPSLGVAIDLSWLATSGSRSCRENPPTPSADTPYPHS